MGIIKQEIVDKAAENTYQIYLHKSEETSDFEWIYQQGVEFAETQLSKLAIEFADWIAENWSPNGRIGYWDSRELNSRNEPKNLVDSTKALFEIFLNKRNDGN